MWYIVTERHPGIEPCYYILYNPITDRPGVVFRGPQGGDHFVQGGVFEPARTKTFSLTFFKVEAV